MCRMGAGWSRVQVLVVMGRSFMRRLLSLRCSLQKILCHRLRTLRRGEPSSLAAGRTHVVLVLASFFRRTHLCIATILGSVRSIDLSRQICPFSPSAQVSCGPQYFAAVTRQGGVYTWGLEAEWRLGHGRHRRTNTGGAAGDQAAYLKMPLRVMPLRNDHIVQVLPSLAFICDPTL